MTKRSICKKCVLSENHPGVEFSADNVCNICEGRYTNDFKRNYNYINDSYEEFIDDSKKRRYDYILMLSGGKDSIYMLYKLMRKTQKKPLVFTYVHHFESENAKDNVKNAVARMHVDHIEFSSETKYKALMRNVFSTGKHIFSSYNSEKTPCILCSYYMIITACIFAYQLGIPYVLYCADPMQMIASMSNIKDIICFMTYELGEKMCLELFGNNYRVFANSSIHKLPRIIFPYISMFDNYEASKIISELKQAQLYDKSPIETSCALYPLLQLYSYSNYDCNYYALEYSSMVRNGEWSRDKALSLNEQYKKMILSVAVDNINKYEIKAMIRSMNLGDSASDDYMYKSIIGLKTVMNYLGLGYNGKNIEVIDNE